MSVSEPSCDDGVSFWPSSAVSFPECYCFLSLCTWQDLLRCSFRPLQWIRHSSSWQTVRAFLLVVRGALGALHHHSMWSKYVSPGNRPDIVFPNPFLKNIIRFLSSVPRNQLLSVAAACKVLIEFSLMRLENPDEACAVSQVRNSNRPDEVQVKGRKSAEDLTTVLLIPPQKHLILLIKGLCTGCSRLDRTEIITFTAMMKSAKLPQTVKTLSDGASSSQITITPSLFGITIPPHVAEGGNRSGWPNCTSCPPTVEDQKDMPSAVSPELRQKEVQMNFFNQLTSVFNPDLSTILGSPSAAPTQAGVGEPLAQDGALLISTSVLPLHDPTWWRAAACADVCSSWFISSSTLCCCCLQAESDRDELSTDQAAQAKMKNAFVSQNVSSLQELGEPFKQ